MQKKTTHLCYAGEISLLVPSKAELLFAFIVHSLECFWLYIGNILFHITYLLQAT